MARSILIRQSSMAGGEIAPVLSNRSDLARYLISLATCRNFIVTPHGVVMNRPGTKFVAETKDSTKRARLVTFTFGTDQNFALEFGEQYIRFYHDGGQVLSGGVPYEIATPYLEADLYNLKFSQVGDIITITHRSYAPRELRRYGNTNWTLAEVGFWNDPAPLNTLMVRVSSAGVEGAAGSVTTVFAVTGVYSDGRESFPRLSQPVGYPTSQAVKLGIYATKSDGPVYYNVYRAILGEGAMVPSPAEMVFDYIGQINPKPDGTIPPLAELGNVMGRVADDTVHPPMWANPFAGPPTAWAVDTYYKIGKRVTANGNTYECIWPGRSASSGTGPSGTAGSIIDGPACRESGVAYAPGNVFEIWGMRAVVTVGGNSAASTHNMSWGGSTVGGTDGTVTYSIASTPTDPQEGPAYWKFIQVGTALSTWPATSAIFDQRKWFANTTEEPAALWGSRVGAYNDFGIDTPLVDDSPLRGLRLDSTVFEEIKWLSTLRSLLAGTTESPWLISGAGGSVDAVTALSKRARPQAFVGSGDVVPLKIGTAVLIVSPLGNTVHELAFDVNADAYRSSDLSIMSQHLLEGHRIVDWTWASYPHGVAWGIREDGVLLGLTYQKEHEIVAWHRHDSAGASGSFETVCSMLEGTECAVYTIVRRTVSGVTKRYVERFASRVLPRLNGVVDVSRSVFLDCSIMYDGAPATVFSGLGHLVGEDVTVLADGQVAGPYTVDAGGQINISGEFPDGASVVIAGLSYTSDLETMDAVSAQAEIHRRLKRVVSVMFEVLESRTMQAGVSFAADDLKQVRARTVAGGYAAMAAYSGDVIVRVPDQFRRSGRAVVRQVDPLPVTVVGITREIELGDD